MAPPTNMLVDRAWSFTIPGCSQYRRAKVESLALKLSLCKAINRVPKLVVRLRKCWHNKRLSLLQSRSLAVRWPSKIQMCLQSQAESPVLLSARRYPRAVTSSPNPGISQYWRARMSQNRLRGFQHRLCKSFVQGSCPSMHHLGRQSR